MLSGGSPWPVVAQTNTTSGSWMRLAFRESHAKQVKGCALGRGIYSQAHSVVVVPSLQMEELRPSERDRERERERVA